MPGPPARTRACSGNGKSRASTASPLDLRLRLPTGYEALEGPARAAVAQGFKRGNLQIGLTVSGSTARESVRLNDEVLADLVAAGERLRERIGGEPLRADVLLSLKGVIEVATPIEDEAETDAVTPGRC